MTNEAANPEDHVEKMFEYGYRKSNYGPDEGWEALGYMAPVTYGFDRIVCHYNAMYIDWKTYMRPAVYGKYVSTSPQKADSDGDGMDDFYELFHGLNPLLGADPEAAGSKDVIAKAYGMPVFYNAYWNEWTHPDYNRYLAFHAQIPTSNRKMPITTPIILIYFLNICLHNFI